MSAWIFQGNPDQFDIDQYLEDRDEILWSVRQGHLKDDMALDDQVFLWRAAGKAKAVAGVVASARIIELPKIQPDDETTDGLWAEPGRSGPELRVRLRIERKCLKLRQVVRRDWLKDDPILRDLRILKMANETNYRIQPNETGRLAALVTNTGNDWTAEECLAGLWAYKETLTGRVSRQAGEPVAIVAIRIGRAATGVYNKLMNFRSIDPTDARKGLSAINQIDRQVFDEYFDTSAGSLDTQRIDDAYKKLWGAASSANPSARQSYTDFGEAPNDDPTEIAEFARKVRKGQPKFRNALLNLYDNRCAITGWGPPEVLQAAHIVRHTVSGINHSDNGLLLRSDVHDLFDADLIAIEPETLIVRVSEKLKGTEYDFIDGVSLRARADGKRPSVEFLQERWDLGCGAGDSSRAQQ